MPDAAAGLARSATPMAAFRPSRAAHPSRSPPPWPRWRWTTTRREPGWSGPSPPMAAFLLGPPRPAQRLRDTPGRRRAGAGERTGARGGLPARAPGATARQRRPDSRTTRRRAGWGWTTTTFGWVDPTSRALLALRLLRRRDGAASPTGMAMLADRECQRRGLELRQPRGDGQGPGAVPADDRGGRAGAPGLRRRRCAAGVDVIERLWSQEAGGLGWGMALAALRLAGRNAGLGAPRTCARSWPQRGCWATRWRWPGRPSPTAPAVETLRIGSERRTSARTSPSRRSPGGRSRRSTGA